MQVMEKIGAEQGMEKVMLTCLASECSLEGGRWSVLWKGM